MGTCIAAWPAVPANNATVVLFTTHDRLTGGAGALVRASLPTYDRQAPEMVELTFHRHNKASATSGLKSYALDDTGAWRETDMKDDDDAATMPKTVPILAAGAEWREKFVTGHLRGFCLEYTAGADNPEEWNGTVAARFGQSVVTV
jgi:hypothetical protein